jgi:hypothetical protein
MVVCGGLWWNYGGLVVYGGITVVCSGFLIVFFFFFFSFYVTPNTVKYFQDNFPKCNQTQEIFFFFFPEIIFIYKHFTVENVLRRNKRNLSIIFSLFLDCI